MKHVAALVLVLAIAVIGRAQTTGTVVRGRVAAADTGAPIPHARVTITNDARPLAPIFSDANGQFVSPPLAAGGRYRLTVTKAGYAQESVAGAALQAGQPADVRLARSAAIVGRVIDDKGDPAIGVPVSVLVQADGGATAGVTPVVTVQTNDLGEFRAGGLPAGRYYVAAITPQLDAATGEVSRGTIFYPAAATLADAQAIVLAPGDEHDGVDFIGLSVGLSESPLGFLAIGVPPSNANDGADPADTGVIRGRVTRADGLSVPNATVRTTVQQVVAGGRRRTTTKSVPTNDDGAYEFDELPAGDYRITASKPGFRTAAFGQRSPTDRGQPVVVTAGQTRSQIDLVLPRFSAVTGRIVDDFGDPVEGVTVRASRLRFEAGRRRLIGVNGTAMQATDDQGRYRLYGMPPGQYIISAEIGQVSALPAAGDLSGFAPTYFPGTTNPADARLVAVPQSEEVPAVDLALVPQPTARITGRRIGPDGEPLGGTLVLVSSARSGAIVTTPTGARIQDDGRFEFPNVAPGEYVIQADRGRGPSNEEGPFASQYVTVNGADVSGVLLQATPGSTVVGRVVVDADVEPPRRLTIVPERADLDRAPLANGSIARADVQPDLTFELRGLHGPRRLVLERPPAGWALKSVLVDGIDVTDTPLPFGTADQSLSEVQVVVTNRLTELTGTAVDSRGQPVAGDYAVLAFPTDRDRWYPGSRYFRRTGPGASGTFSLRGLPPGDYFVAAVRDLPVLRDGPDAWQDPEFLESIALQSTSASLAEGQSSSASPRLITP
ncbi:MAG TPA: carboxypeptidase-like regulatory domain-containing protein [Vicinamibacterales bacterium]|nr:carboxypeptidase-like regulatory domain-containing protein [Vicinamibacterales bacterium]